MKTTLILLSLLLSFSSIANSKIESVNNNIQELKSKTINSSVLEISVSDVDVLKLFASQESGFNYDTQYYTNVSFKSLLSNYLSEDSWYPNFCEQLTKKESISSCAKKLKKLLKPIKKNISYVYLNGDDDGSDYKCIYIVASNTKNKKVVIRLEIQEERDLD